MTDDNQEVGRDEANKIRRLANFEIKMLVSEIHDHGWPIARRTLALMPTIDDRKIEGRG